MPIGPTQEQEAMLREISLVFKGRSSSYAAERMAQAVAAIAGWDRRGRNGQERHVVEARCATAMVAVCNLILGQNMEKGFLEAMAQEILQQEKQAVASLEHQAVHRKGERKQQDAAP